jgi:integrase
LRVLVHSLEKEVIEVLIETFIQKATGIELKKPHARACRIAGIEYFPPYTFRHTCLTLWSTHMDPLAYFAGHSDFATTRRYVHPNPETGREAMERAREAQGRHNSGTVALRRVPMEHPQKTLRV